MQQPLEAQQRLATLTIILTEKHTKITATQLRYEIPVIFELSNVTVKYMLCESVFISIMKTHKANNHMQVSGTLELTAVIDSWSTQCADMHSYVSATADK